MTNKRLDHAPVQMNVRIGQRSAGGHCKGCGHNHAEPKKNCYCCKNYTEAEAEHGKRAPVESTHK